ncbi:MAG: heme ABC exporter ATP-binding protein CcmA [Gammaproteobacteria bacterium]|nr:heme ABC exporter ATP-binding protein CcmA [Gammaproteobacteria bacterium]
MLPKLKVKNLSCSRADNLLFHDLNFEVVAGKNIEIIGSNGSGKTTLLRILLGLINIGEGKLEWLDNEENYNHYRSIDCFYQGHSLGIKNLLSAHENLSLSSYSFGASEEKIAYALDRVGIKNHLSFTSELSVGQKKRISIARWLLKDFGIYFIDEPFSALDDQATSLIIEIIEELNAKGASFVITGHRASDVISNQIFLDHEV